MHLSKPDPKNPQTWDWVPELKEVAFLKRYMEEEHQRPLPVPGKSRKRRGEKVEGKIS